MKLIHQVLALVLLLAFTPFQVSAQSQGPSFRNVVAGELIVKVQPGTSLNQQALASGSYAAQLNRTFKQLGVAQAELISANSDTYRIQVPRSANLERLSQQIAGQPGVIYAEPNAIRTLMRTPNDTVFEQQWALRKIQAPEAWDITTGNEIVIALLDTGVSNSHPDLKNKLVEGYDFANRDHDPNDDEGHGTYTAGVAAASSNNGQGIAGVCWGCRIMPIKVLNSRGQGDDANIAAAIRWATDRGVRIISMSLGGPDNTEVLRDAVQYAADRNVLLIAASGNGQADGNQANYPAAYPSVLAVAATTANDQVTGFSTTGDYLDISAPGVGVWSTLWSRSDGNTYGASNGTSAACPHVAGAAALVLSIRPDLTANQVAEILQSTADDQGTPGWDPLGGYGRLNVLRAVQAASDPATTSRSSIQGRVIGDLNNLSVSLNTGQQTGINANGTFRFDNLPAGGYTVSLNGANVAPQQVWLSGTVLSTANITFQLGFDNAQFFSPVPAPVDGARYFPETGHTLRGQFLSYWQSHGGLPIFGFPISEAFLERGEDGNEYIVQYFERYRLEQHPENAPPYNILLSRMGINMLELSGRDWFSFPKGQAQDGCRYFEATGHSLCGVFLQYWQSQGLEFDGRAGKSFDESLALFGMPISEPQIEISSDGQPYLTQWFERARFEDHGANGVLLGLLGNDLASTRGLKR